MFAVKRDETGNAPSWRSILASESSGWRSFEAFVGRALRGCSATRIDLFDARRRRSSLLSMNRRPYDGVASNGLFVPLSTRQRAETNDLAHVIVCYVIYEELVMCDWLPVLLWFPAKSDYKITFLLRFPANTNNLLKFNNSNLLKYYI